MIRPVLALTAVALLLIPASAAAATRAEYDAQVNQICAATNAQSDQLLRNFLEKQHKIGKRKSSSSKGPDAFLDKAARRMGDKQVALFTAELTQLQQVPAATGDEAAVASWLAVRAEEASFGKQVRAKQRSNEKGVAARIKTTEGRAKQRRLDRQLEKLLKQAQGLETQDAALSTQLGATSCYPSAANGEAVGSQYLEG
jgi:hypothetical protein